MTDGTPCWESGLDPDDWFIGRDGKQYPDDEWLTDDERRAISRTVLARDGETAEEHQERVDLAIHHAEGERRRRALIRRRKARDACYDCPVRTQCLEIALREGHRHGTWGGYYEEDIRLLVSEIKRRKRARGEEV